MSVLVQHFNEMIGETNGLTNLTKMVKIGIQAKKYRSRDNCTRNVKKGGPPNDVPKTSRYTKPYKSPKKSNKKRKSSKNGECHLFHYDIDTLVFI
jgi:hypothetical protein